MTRVVHVIAPAGEVGGAEEMVLLHVDPATPRGSTSSVAALVPAPAHAFLAEGTRRGAHVDMVTASDRRYDRQARALAELLVSRGADVVHAHNPHADLVALLAARSVGIPLVVTHHGYLRTGLRDRFYEWVDRQVLSRAAAIVCVAASGNVFVTEESGRSAGRVRVIPNAIAPDISLARDAARRVLGVTSGEPVIGWVGRLSPEKHPSDFVRVLAALGDQRTTGVMIGAGSEAERVARLAASYGVRERLRLTGWHVNARRLFPAFDVLVITSAREQLPLVALQAMEAGVPVVAMAAGGLPGLLADGRGWPVPAGDTGAGARAVDEVLRDATRAEQRTVRAHQYVRDHHGVEAWAAQFERLYADVMRAFATPQPN